MRKETFHCHHKNGSMRMFDKDNPDIQLFNMIDDELIRLSGSELYIYKYEVDENFDDIVWGESCLKRFARNLFSWKDTMTPVLSRKI